MRPNARQNKTLGAMLARMGSKACWHFFGEPAYVVPLSDKLEREQLLKKAVARWENEGGHDTQQNAVGDAEQAVPHTGASAVLPLTNAELVQLQIRVIALENLVIALLSQASEQQLQRVREIAETIVPRTGVEHRLTVQAAAHMEHLAQRSVRV